MTLLKKEITTLTETKGKLEWRLGEVTQFWNDSKWRLNLNSLI